MRAGAPPHPLVDARHFVAGQVVHTSSGWHFELEKRRSVTMPWPTWPANPSCLEQANPPHELLAWPIEGSEPARYVVLGDEPILVEARPGCLAAVSARPPLPEILKQTLPVTAKRAKPAGPSDLADPNALVLTNVDPRLADWKLVLNAGDLPWLWHRDTVLSPQRLGGDSDLTLNCEGPDAPQSAPGKREVTVIARGTDAIDELELLVDERCTSKPRTAAAVSHTRRIRWVLVRAPESPKGWVQLTFQVVTGQDSYGAHQGGKADAANADGDLLDELVTESIFSWRLGAMTLVGHSQTWSQRAMGKFTNSRSTGRRSTWAFAPSEQPTFGAAGALTLTPASAAPQRAPDHRHEPATAGESMSLGNCELSFGSLEVLLECANDQRPLVSLEEEMSEATLAVHVWDLGLAHWVEAKIKRVHVWTEEDDDGDSKDRYNEQQQSWTGLISKRSGLLRIDTSQRLAWD